MRIVGGRDRGRALVAPKGQAVTRPTSDRARETIFNVLGQRCDGLKVLDLYAGTGAMGLEAISRGADRATLVEKDALALRACRENILRLNCSAVVELVGLPLERAWSVLRKQGCLYDLVFIDPPYALRAGAAALEGLEHHQLAGGGARAVIEHSKEEVLSERVGAWKRVDVRALGDTRVSIFDFDLSPSLPEGWTP